MTWNPYDRVEVELEERERADYAVYVKSLHALMRHRAAMGDPVAIALKLDAPKVPAA